MVSVDVKHHVYLLTYQVHGCMVAWLKQQLRGALVAAQWRRDTALTLPFFWRPSTVSPVFFERYPRSSLHSLAPPPPPPPPSLISNLASVDVKLCVTRACLLVCHDQLAVAKDISPMARKIVTLNNTKTRSLCQWRWIETISTGSPQRITLTLFTVRDTVWPSAPHPPPPYFPLLDRSDHKQLHG